MNSDTSDKPLGNEAYSAQWDSGGGENAGSRWKPVDLTVPEKWFRSRAWRWGDSRWIVAAAYCPTVFGLGGELLTGYGKGVAIFLGPLWLGIAASFKDTTPETERGTGR